MDVLSPFACYVIVAWMIFEPVNAFCEYGRSNNDFCYSIHTFNTSWSEARRMCAAYDGHLAAIYDSASQRTIQELMQHRGVSGQTWIGGQLDDPRASINNNARLWRWIDKDCQACQKATACQGGQLDLAFLLDNSGSVSDIEWVLMLQFIRNVISKFQIGANQTLVSVSTFGNSAKTVISFNDYGDARPLDGAISRLQHHLENTNISAGLELIRKNVFGIDGRVEAANVVVILTDGVFTETDGRTLGGVAAVRNAGIEVFVVAIGSDVMETQVRRLAAPPQQNRVTYWLIGDFTSLGTPLVDEVVNRMCSWHNQYNIIQSTALETQGCYKFRWYDLDLTYHLTFLEVITPITCSLSCHMAGYRYSGVTVDTMSGYPVDQCYCGQSFGRHGSDGNCEMLCGADETQYCGNTDHILISKAAGQYGPWAFGQPNNFDGDQHCGAIDTQWVETDVYKFNDLHCHESYRYLCEIGSCPAYTKSDGYYRQLRGGGCLFYSLDADTWSRGRNACMAKGGDLLTFKNNARHQEVTSLVNGMLQDTRLGSMARPTSLWIGLQHGGLFWNDGQGNKMSWSNFGRLEPNFVNKSCVYVDPANNFEWTVGHCQRKLKHFLCQTELQVFRVPNTDRTSTTTAISGLVTPSSDPAASTSQNFVLTYWWVILVIVVLIILVLILLILYCCYRKKNNERSRVKPGREIYDARPDAPVPVSSAIGDEIFISEQPYTFFLETDTKNRMFYDDVGYARALPEPVKTSERRDAKRKSHRTTVERIIIGQ